MLPSRYQSSKALSVKQGAVANLKHLAAPLKGLSLTTDLTEGDPLTAPILENFIIEEDKIRVRFGSRKAYTHAAAKPVEALIPHYGAGAHRLAVATNGELRMLDDTLVKGGFTSNDWHWTSYSNLSAVEHTILVNGVDGVWSWDGGTVSTDPAPVAVTNLSKGNPAVCTVAAGDISKFANGMTVFIAGATGTGLVNANGPRVIYSVGVPANTFTLAGVDTSTATGPQTTGVTADPPGTGIIKEVVLPPDWLPHINPLQFQIVVSHMNRLWFADNTNLSLYYLPLQQKSGVLSELPLNAVFKRGGSVRAVYTWTQEGGTTMSNQLVIFSSNGECAIYGGVDPDSDFNLAGLYRFDAPMSKNCVVNYGGELHVLISTGFVPMSTLMRAEDEQLGKYDKEVYSHFQKHMPWRGFPGWSVFINPNTGRVICNMPMGTGIYHQTVRAMQNPAWTHWSGINARCWGWANHMVYFGDDHGHVYEFDPQYLNDDGKPIYVDVQLAWSNFGTSASKTFLMVLPYIITDGIPKPYIEVKVDYDTSALINQPDVTQGSAGATWDEATWDVDYWAGSIRNWNNWQGVASSGRVGGVRLTAYIHNCSFAIAGFDVLYEKGSLFG